MPVSGDVVQFNGGIDSTDNIAGLALTQVHFTAGGDIIRGATPLGIGAGFGNNIVNNAGVNTFDASLPISLGPVTPVFVSIPAGEVDIDSNISGASGIELVSGSANGTLVFGGSNNTYGGTTFVNDGTLVLNSGAVHSSIPGDLVIGDGVGAPGSAVVRELEPNQINDPGSVTVNSDGLLDTNGNFESIKNLTVNGGQVATGLGGSLSVSNALSFTGNSLTITATGASAGFASLNGASSFFFFNISSLAFTASVSTGSVLTINQPTGGAFGPAGEPLIMVAATARSCSMAGPPTRSPRPLPGPERAASTLMARSSPMTACRRSSTT